MSTPSDTSTPLDKTQAHKTGGGRVLAHSPKPTTVARYAFDLWPLPPLS